MTLPVHRKRESEHHVNGCKTLRADCIADRVWLAVPQATEGEHVGD